MMKEEQGQMFAQKDGGGGEVGIGFDFKDIDTPAGPGDLLAEIRAAEQEEAERRAAEQLAKDEEYAQKVLEKLKKQEQKQARPARRGCGCW